MIEAEWLQCKEPPKMLKYLRGKCSDRKLRLFAVACCRQFSDLPLDHSFHQALATAEQYADKRTTKAALKRARLGVNASRHALPTGQPDRHVEWVAYWLAEVAASENAVGMVIHEMERLASLGLIQDDKRKMTIPLLHCVFGNPFHAITNHHRWSTKKSVVPGLARVIYDDKVFTRLPELADALEEAGCNSTEVLSHCRSDGPHVRGCWVVDVLLGKD